MTPLFLYPALSGRGGGRGEDGPNFVFRNNELLKMSKNPFTTSDAFFRTFASPCYRIPAMVITKTGRIIVSSDYRSKPDDQVAIWQCVAYSDDNGRTWKKQILGSPPLTSNPSGFTRCMDGTMFIDHVGKIHIICGYWNGQRNNVNWTQTHPDDTWTIVEFISSDNGTTWETKSDFRRRVTGVPEGKSWLGGVGNCVVTKFGTIIVPIQMSLSPGTVAMSFIYSNDGVNWTKFPGKVDGCSETSVSQWVNSTGNVELLFISRKDPNTGNKKKATYVIQNANGEFAKTSFTDYGIYNDKIPARGNSGCQGSQICPCDETGNLAPRSNVWVSYAKNFFSNIHNFERDHITIAGFSWTNFGDTSANSRQLKDIEMVNVNMGGERNGTPFGGYSIMYYDHTSRKMGIAYENMLGICYKDLSYLIPQFLEEPAV